MDVHTGKKEKDHMGDPRIDRDLDGCLTVHLPHEIM